MVIVAAAGGAEAAEPLLFDIPRLEKIAVDGKSAEWDERGFRVELLQGVDGTLRPAEEFDAQFRLGWESRGLAVLVTVRDKTPYEPREALRDNDSVELFVAAKRGSTQAYQVIVAPGRDAGQELRRQVVALHPPASGESPAVEVARSVTESGYVLELLLPWKNLALQPRQGEEIAFQLAVYDREGPGRRSQVVWYPRDGTRSDTNWMHRLRLADRPGPPVRVAASGAYERFRRTRVRVHALASEAGKEIEARNGRRVLGAGKLEAGEGRASASLALPIPAPGEAWGSVTVHVAGKPMASVELPSADEQRARALMEAELRFQPFVFTGTAFPAVEFAEPSLVEDLIGPYTIRTTFYDRDYRPVKTAEKPGRYGAVIEIVPEKGRVHRRYRTLFRQESGFAWWRSSVPASIGLPKEIGIDPAVTATQRRALGDFVKDLFFNASSREPHGAQLLAGLAETSPGAPEARKAEDAWARDRQWWVGLKRMLTGMDKRYPDSFVCPRPMSDAPAPELREGKAVEAGMKPDAVEKIDAVCKEWAADSDQGFGVCLARHGKVFFHRAYGERDDRPMTLADKSWMASISKLIAGAQMLMLVDQGLVDLDAPIDTYLPALRDIPVRKKLTIRHLFTHTNGLWGHWGDDLHDFEEVVAGYYPYLEVGQRYEYNGAGFALAGKIIEMLTGEAMTAFGARHLFDPLGCTDTDMTTLSWATWSTPMDIARIGQMLLNRGAYGEHRFFSEKAFQSLLPEKLSERFGNGIDEVYGLGSSFYTNEGLGKGTFGHGAASSATLRIDPENDLVIVMTRNEAGRSFGTYHPRFLKAIVEGLDRTQ
jgi:CubicO group peptidase (beta-lactamase class C family)